MSKNISRAKHSKFASFFRVLVGVVFPFLALGMLAAYFEAPARSQEIILKGIIGTFVMAASGLAALWLFIKGLNYVKHKWRTRIQPAANKIGISSKAVASEAMAKGKQAAKAVKDMATTRDLGDRYDNLMKIKNLLDSGVLTEEEYEIEKRRLLDP